MSRFAIQWILVTVPTLALLSPVHLIYMRGRGGVGCFEAVFFNDLVFNVLAASAAAFGQEWLLSWHRRPLRRWWGCMTAAALLSWLANYGLLSQIYRLFDFRGPVEVWLIAGLTSVSAGVAFSAAAGLAIWGRTWPPIWRAWMAGVVGIHAAQAVVHALLYMSVGDPSSTSFPLTWSILLKGIDASVVAAGTVLWMDRLIFRPGLRTEN